MIDTVIIGAGPYGLSLAAHLRGRRIPFRIFGRPMDSWLAHMPKGMCLKSDGFASDIYDGRGELTLRQFCKERGIEYADSGIPVRLETFTSYGLAFRERMVPEVEEKLVISIAHSSKGYVLCFDDGETVVARRVVLAVGITHFEHLPETLANLPPDFLSHSARHSDVEVFSGRSVVVIGGGSSALDWAALLSEAGVHVQLVARQAELRFHSQPTGKPRTLWQRIRHPQSGLGPGWRSRFYSDAPWAFHHLPQRLRLEIVRRTLGPSGGWFIRDKVMEKVPLLLGYTLKHAQVQGDKVSIRLRSADGEERAVLADHIIAATGYKVDLNRLRFLSAEIRSNIRTVNATPVLSSTFESSIPGLYFVGIAAANSFGPVMRFACGAGFAARTISSALQKSVSLEATGISIPKIVTTTK